MKIVERKDGIGGMPYLNSVISGDGRGLEGRSGNGC
jgi:hypothetical protein